MSTGPAGPEPEEPFIARWQWKWVLLVLAFLLALLLFLVDDTIGQTWDAGLGFEVEQWPAAHKDYMNRMEFQARLGMVWGPVWARGRAQWGWWGSPRAKITGSLWNLEANKALERSRSLAAGFQVEPADQWTVRLGAKQRRRAINHFTHGVDRHPYYPEDWRVGVIGCNGGDAPNWPPNKPQCGSQGYFDLVGPLIEVQSPWLLARVEGPMWTWKDLTLPYPRGFATVEVRPGAWRLRFEGEAFGPAGFGYDAEVSRSIPAIHWLGIPKIPFVRIGMRASDHLPDPGWGRGPGDNLRRLAAVFAIEVATN